MLSNENQNVNIENLKLATTKKRIQAFVIDDLAITFIVTLIMWDTILQNGSDILSVLSIINNAFIQIVILKFLYQTIFIWYYGATLGKILIKIKVIDFDNFENVSFINSALRSFGRIISESIFYLGFISAFYLNSKQTLHDKIGRTLVVDA
jgi:uncharacterized RDD family membrane protein YckC